MAQLEEAGFAAVYNLSGWTGNVNIYVRDVERINKIDKASEKASKDAAKAKKELGKEVGDAGKQAGRAAGLFRRAGDEAKRSGDNARSGAQGFGRFTSSLLNISSAINIMQAGYRAFQNMISSVSQFTERAAQVETVTLAFNNLAQSMGGADTVMAQLREQSQGMVSDTELMRLTNLALLNTSREYAEEVGPRFGTVIAAAYAGATATGQNFSWVLDKVTRGMRLQSRLLLDDIGVRVTAAEANEIYAASIGTTVDALTDEQKQVAFAREALRQMEEIAAGGTGMNTLAATVARGTAAIQNNLNQMAANAAPSLQAFNAGFSSVAASVTGTLAQLDPAPFFQGGANIIAALAQGLLAGATLVVRAVTIIAQTIADFLHGLSPPPKGPLSTIDAGGANVIAAWVDGFNQVSLAPAEQLAGKVNDILNGAGGLETGDKVTVIEAMQERLNDRLRAAVAALSRGADNAAEVRALDSQRALVAQKLKLLKEQEKLERVFGKATAATLVGSGGGGAVGGGGGAGGGGGGTGASTETKQTEAETDALKEKKKASDEAAKALENLRNKTAKESGTRKGAGGGGGSGRGSTGIPVLDDLGIGALPTGSSFSGDDAYDPAAGGGPGSGSGIAARLTETFEGITDSWNTFVDELETAKQRLDDIDLWGAIREGLEKISGIETPGELVDFVVNFGLGLFEVPIDIMREFITEFERLTGIDLPPWLESGLQVAAGIAGIGIASSLAAPAIGLVKTAILGIAGLFTPVNLAILGIVGGLVFLNNRFGSITAGIEEAIDNIEEYFDVLQLHMLEVQRGITEALGGDTGWIDEQQAAIGARQTARRIRDALIREVDDIVNNRAIGLSPLVQTAIREDRIEVPSTVRIAIENRLNNTLQGGDPLAIAHAITLADFLGVEVPQRARDQLQGLIDAELEANPVSDIEARIAEVQASTIDEVVLLDEAQGELRDQLGEAVYQAWEGSEVMVGHIEALPDPSNFQVTLSADFIRQLDTEFGNAVSYALNQLHTPFPVMGNEIIPDVGPPTTRGGGIGGGGNGRLVSAREGGVPGNIMDVLNNRAGGESQEVLTPTLEEVNAWSAEIIATIDQTRSTLLDTFLLPATEQFTAFDLILAQNAFTITTYDLAMMTASITLSLYQLAQLMLNQALIAGTGATIAQTTAFLGLGASSAVAGTGINLLRQGILGYLPTIDEGIRRTKEFIEMINAIPERISVILDVTVNVVNLTSIGNAVADAMADADAQAAGGGDTGGGGGGGGGEGRALGGDVFKGIAYEVGERGRELFIPGMDGKIIPNDQIIFAPAPTVPVTNVTVSAPGHGPGGDTFNFYGPADGDSIRRAARERKAFRRY